jgi:hypothetical protein
MKLWAAQRSPDSKRDQGGAAAGYSSAPAREKCRNENAHTSEFHRPYRARGRPRGSPANSPRAVLRAVTQKWAAGLKRRLRFVRRAPMYSLERDGLTKAILLISCGKPVFSRNRRFQFPAAPALSPLCRRFQSAAGFNQKTYFSANWIRRGFTDVAVICPKLPRARLLINGAAAAPPAV